MANTKRTLCERATNKPAQSRPHVNSVWYKNPLLSDVTVIYGVDGEKKFVGHRLILCSASEWFMRASKNFKEADNREILLEGDHPEGLEALFQFAYNNTYTEIADVPDQLALLQKQFQQHLHIFAMADKYQAQVLEDQAYCRIRDLVDLYTETQQASSYENAMMAPAFFKWMVQQVYEQGERYFPALRNDSQKAKEVAEGALLPAYSPASPTYSSETQQYNSTSSEDAPVGAMSKQHISALEPTSSPPSPHPAEDEGPLHPIDRIQELLVQGAIKAWSNSHPDFNRNDLVPIAQAFPDFGTDLAVAALKSTLLGGVSEPLSEDAREELMTAWLS